MHKLLVGLVGASALAIGSAASAQIVVNFNSATNPVGPTHTYTTTAGNIVATGYSAAGTTSNLYSKSGGGDENGLGLTDDPSLQNEISDASSFFIQLDLSGLSGVSAVNFLMGSTTAGEGWAVYGSNTAGCAALSVPCGTLVNSGSNETWNALSGFGTYNYFDFYATGTSNNAPSNVLLSELSLAVPEPSTWAMMLIGFGAIGFAARRSRRKVALAQLA